MKNFLIYLTVLNFLVLSNVKSQDLALQWHNFYGSEDRENLMKAVAVEDGYLLAGAQLSNVYLIKLDLDNNVVWENQYDGFFIVDVIEQEDGFVIGLRGRDFEVFKISNTGEELWRHKYGGTATDDMISMNQYSDGFLLVGWTNSQDGDVSNGNIGENGWVVHIDKSGNLIWERTYATPEGEVFTKCLIGQDFLLFLGLMNWILKTDLDGNVLFSRTLSDPSYQFGLNRGSLATDSGDFIIPGQTISDRPDAAIIKLTTDGDIVWSVSYGSNGSTQEISELKELENGTIAVLASNIGHGTDPEAQIRYTELDSGGGIIRDESHLGLFVTGISILDSDPCPFLFAGTSRWFDEDNAIGLRDYGLFCFDEIFTNVDNSATQADITIYPNPSLGLVTIEMEPSLNALIRVTNSLGELIMSKKISSSSHTLDLRSVTNSIYFINIQSTDKSRQPESIVKKVSLIR